MKLYGIGLITLLMVGCVTSKFQDRLDKSEFQIQSNMCELSFRVCQLEDEIEPEVFVACAWDLHECRQKIKWRK